MRPMTLCGRGRTCFALDSSKMQRSAARPCLKEYRWSTRPPPGAPLRNGEPHRCSPRHGASQHAAGVLSAGRAKYRHHLHFMERRHELAARSKGAPGGAAATQHWAGAQNVGDATQVFLIEPTASRWPMLEVLLIATRALQEPSSSQRVPHPARTRCDAPARGRLRIQDPSRELERNSRRPPSAERRPQTQ